MSGQGRRKGKRVHLVPKVVGRAGSGGGGGAVSRHDRVASELLRRMVDDEVARIREEDNTAQLLRCMAVVDVQMQQLENELKRSEIKQKKNIESGLSASTNLKDHMIASAEEESAESESGPADSAVRAATCEEALVIPEAGGEGAAAATEQNAPADDAPSEEAPDDDAPGSEAPEDDASTDEDEEDEPAPPSNGPPADADARPQQPPPAVQPAPTVANLAAALADLVSVESAARAAEAYVDLKKN